MRRVMPVVLLIVIVFGVSRIGTFAQESSKQEPSSLENSKGRTIEVGRREVRMLDDIYKGGIVTITENYVNEKETIPAGTAFKQLFIAAEKKGWHRVRILDVTGEPYSDENVAEDAFEKNAVKQLASGKKWIERIETREGKRHLRVATPIPVVFAKCTMCHDNYADLPKDTAIGALSYTVPLDGMLITKLTKSKKEKAN